MLNINEKKYKQLLQQSFSAVITSCTHYRHITQNTAICESTGICKYVRFTKMQDLRGHSAGSDLLDCGLELKKK